MDEALGNVDGSACGGEEAVVSALSEKDETADIWLMTTASQRPTRIARHGNVPLEEDVDVYFEREVKPHVPDCLGQTTSVKDQKDGKVGKVGYEDQLQPVFYQYQRPVNWNLSRPTSQSVEKDIWRC